MALYTPEYKPTGDEIAVIKTSKGTIRVQLAGKDAPIHVGNFVELANKGFYDDLKFHRYVPGFVIQGGCPKDGTLAMARSQNPNSAGSQFYFCLGAQPMLDDGYTVFGDTIEGKDVIGELRQGDVIESITIENQA